MLGACLAEALGDKAGMRRFASMLLPLDEALIEVALDLSGRPYLAYSLRIRAGHARTGHAALRPAARRGVLARLRHRGQPDAAHPSARGQEHAPHARGQLQGGRPVPARRRARRGGWHPLHQGQPVTAAPRIAVLDYGIGNLRSAEKALQHVGAAARLVDDPGRSPGPMRWCCPASVPSAPAPGRCAKAVWKRRRARPSRPVCRSSASASASSCSTRARSRARARRSRDLPRRGGPAARRREAPADAVEHAPGGRAEDEEPAPLRGLGPRPWVYFVHSFAPPVGPRRWPCVTTAGRSRRWPPRARCGAPSSTRRSPAPAGWRSWPTSCAPPGGLMELLPAIDLRGGTAVRLTQGDFDREERYGDPARVGGRLRGGRRALDPRRRSGRGPHRCAA